MKKAISLISAAILLFCLCGCGEKAANRTAGNNTKTVSDVLNGAGESSKTDASSDSSTRSEKSDIPDQKCDVDLTSMSSTMIYAEVSNMLTSPADYMGKTVKMNGSFSIYQTEERNYYACIIADATACCSQGIEFVLKDPRKYPEEYPNLGDEITVIGKFGTYLEDTTTYCQLADAVLY